MPFDIKRRLASSRACRVFWRKTGSVQGPFHSFAGDRGQSWRSRVGTFTRRLRLPYRPKRHRRQSMHGIIYIVGLIVVILAILSFFGLR